MAEKMRAKIGPAPDGVVYPVWALHTQNWTHERPDLRSEGWCCGDGGIMYACIEAEVPCEQVLLSDFDAWHCVPNRWLVSDTEEENDAQNAFFEKLSVAEQDAYGDRNWERIFDVSVLSNGWTERGRWIQAVFRELR